MPELRNCPECGRVFAYVGKNLCHKCIDKEEDEFRVVRVYVRENPGATIIETSEETGVDEETILRFLREGRLISRGLKASYVIHCERCGALIDDGRYCHSCLSELDGQLRRTIQGSSSSDRADRDAHGMHILEHEKVKKPEK